ncbi:MAG TPA: 30S ribosomal protein THX [Planctomycetota bacterium]|nr:30S ribosomal protein THX [Planctomycetota bacterium]HQB00747.1 30S ribosomal protein THX [Planctomycetota bacterium]
MGKGDRRTRRGKIFRGTFGVCRPQKRTKNVAKSEKVDIAINTEKEETKD